MVVVFDTLALFSDAVSFEACFGAQNRGLVFKRMDGMVEKKKTKGCTSQFEHSKVRCGIKRKKFEKEVGKCLCKRSEFLST